MMWTRTSTLCVRTVLNSSVSIRNLATKLISSMANTGHVNTVIKSMIPSLSTMDYLIIMFMLSMVKMIFNVPNVISNLLRRTLSDTGKVGDRIFGNEMVDP